MDSYLVLLIFLILLSGAFSGAEIALTSLSPAKVNTLKEDHRFGAKAIYKLKQVPERFLITVLIGNNLLNTLVTVLATVWGTQTFKGGALGIVTGALTLIILIFAEITPKTFAQKHSVMVARLTAYPILGIMYVLFPIVWLLEKFIHSLMKVLKAKNPITSMSEEEILAMVDIGTQEGVIEEHEQELIENVLDFTETTAEEVMTIEADIEALNVDTTIKDAAHFFTTHSHSRIPIYKDNMDNILGIITVHDILKIIHANDGAKTLKEVKYSLPIVIPKTKSISKLFQEFQKRRQHIAIVVDERGHTVGLVTMEDILEEIVGDIVDEQDKEEDKIKKIGKNEWLAEADITIEEVNDALDIELEYPEHQTLSLLILEEVQGFPSLGEKIEYQGIAIQVKEMSKKKIEKVLITKL